MMSRVYVAYMHHQLASAFFSLSLCLSLFLLFILVLLKRIVADAHTDAVVVTATNVIATSCRIRFQVEYAAQSAH